MFGVVEVATASSAVAQGNHTFVDDTFKSWKTVSTLIIEDLN